MSEPLHDCPESVRVLDGEADPQHLLVCSPCGDLAADLEHMRAGVATLPVDGWAGEAPEPVDVEAALSLVLAEGRPRRRRVGPRQGQLALRVLASAAAALLVFSVGAPVLLRHRIEHTSANLAAPDPEVAVFWTSYGPRR